MQREWEKPDRHCNFSFISDIKLHRACETSMDSKMRVVEDWLSQLLNVIHWIFVHVVKFTKNLETVENKTITIP